MIESMDTMNMKNTNNGQLNEILRGEMSAKESYDQIFEKIESDAEKKRLKEFKAEHMEAIDFWKHQARVEGILPDKNSGVWGKAVEAFIGTSKLFGNTTALKALKEGEEHGLKSYKKLLESDKLTAFQKDQINKRFVPMQKKHINSLNAMIKMH